jgi:hypothetical protein
MGHRGEQSSGITVEAEDGDPLLPKVDRNLPGGSRDINVLRNRCEGNYSSGITVVSSRKDTVSGVFIAYNTLMNNRGSGIFVATGAELQELRTTSGIVIQNNRFIVSDGHESRDIWLYFAKDVTVKENTHSNSFTGIRSDATRNIVSDVNVNEVK